MSFAAAILIVAQSAGPQVAEANPISVPVSARPVALQARASARIIRPARIDFSSHDEAVQSKAQPNVRESQRSRDAAGTPWIEFS